MRAGPRARPFYRVEPAAVAAGCGATHTPPQPPSDPADMEPDERRKVRGSRLPSLGPWLVLCLIAIGAAAVYAAFAG
jgi:hypothetical protein